MDAIRIAAQESFEQVVYAKMPPRQKKYLNKAHLENGTHERTVS